MCCVCVVVVVVVDAVVVVRRREVHPVELVCRVVARDEGREEDTGAGRTGSQSHESTPRIRVNVQGRNTPSTGRLVRVSVQGRDSPPTPCCQSVWVRVQGR